MLEPSELALQDGSPDPILRMQQEVRVLCLELCPALSRQLATKRPRCQLLLFQLGQRRRAARRRPTPLPQQQSRKQLGLSNHLSMRIETVPQPSMAAYHLS